MEIILPYKSKQEAECFRQVWHTSDHGLSFYDNPNRVGLMAHVIFSVGNCSAQRAPQFHHDSIGGDKKESRVWSDKQVMR